MRMLRTRWRKRDQTGYAAVFVALLVPTVFLGLAAIGVDTARWAIEIERVQRAADAAAMAGVTYMPTDLPAAKTTALSMAAKNGYPVISGVTSVDVAAGTLPSQLRVTITSTITNTFGTLIGTPRITIQRSALADFSAPSPMGSPCNTFGNEPPSQAGAALPTGTALPSVPFPQNNCSSTPQFWAAIEGPDTDKVQGDRYMTSPCTTASTFGCASSKNSETHPEGYFFAIHVEQIALNTPIDIQIYDPAFVYTTIGCSSLPSTGTLSNSMNPYTSTDGKLRYTQWKNTANPPAVINAGAQKYCSGDYNPGGSAPDIPPTTSFVVREQTPTADPMKGAVVSNCTKQFTGTSSTPTVNSLTDGQAAYNPQIASVFHEWVSLCSFTPTRIGDYYLQVRTNVSAGGTTTVNKNSSGTTFSPVVYTGNAAASTATGNNNTAEGLNSFALRAVPSNTSNSDNVAISGYSRMPILQNANTSSVTFNLIQALPNSKGQYLAFDFYDAADGSTGNGSIKVLAPGDATGAIVAGATIPGCQGALNNASYTSLTNCTVTVNAGTHNGQLQHVVIPLPADYGCDPATLGGCWFRVQITFAAGSNVTDFTTWDANVGGDPVRLIE